MNIIQNFREQHDELLIIANKIWSCLHVPALADDASGVRMLLADFLGKLTVHLAMEDNVLYPRLLQNSDRNIRTSAQTFVREMGSISDDLKIYKTRWTSALIIQENPEQFIEQTKNIFEKMVKRIEKENEELYVNAEKLFSG
jgi:hemerythrin-like domain-containing protein